MAVDPPPRRDDIQGLRAIAVVSVVLYHAWGPFAPGGFVGVDVFFVISGFVITRSILRESHLGTFTIASFYRRRIRRIFPALYVMCALVLIASSWLLAPAQFLELGKTALSTVLFASNFEFLKLSGYFGAAASLKPLLHTWSLAVEEQFYLVYPLLVVLLWRQLPRLFVPALGALALTSLALSEWLLRRDPAAAFYLAMPRAFELLLGAIVGVGSPRRPLRAVREASSAIGLSMIGAAIFLYRDETRFPGFAALLPCLGTALIIQAGKGGPSAVGRLLSARALTGVGDLSYSLYLWHWPVLVLAGIYAGGDLGAPATALCVCAALAASIASYQFIEKPLLAERRNGLPYLRIGAAAMTAGAAVCTAIVVTQGLPARFSPSTLAIFAASTDFNRHRQACHNDRVLIPYSANCIFGAGGAPPDVAVWGDSHGAELSVALGERLRREGRAVMEITASACPPAIDYNLPERPLCAKHNAETLGHLIGDDRIQTVVLAVEFNRYQRHSFEAMLKGYGAVIGQLRRAGKRIVIVYPIPTFDFDPPSVLGLRHEFGKPLDTVGLSRVEFDSRNRRALEFLDAIAFEDQVERLVPADLLCGATLCGVYAADQRVLYFDKEHLSIAGARILADRLPL